MATKIENMLNKGRWEASRRPQRSSGVITGEFTEALNAHISGDFAGAIQRAQSVPDWENHPAAHRIIGLAMEGLGEIDDAIEAHKTALALNEGYPERQAGDEINLASAYTARGENERALTAYERAFHLQPNWLAAPLGIISILNRGQRKAELFQFLTDVLSADSSIRENAVFLDHLENDTDFIGVKDMIDMIGTKTENHQ